MSSVTRATVFMPGGRLGVSGAAFVAVMLVGACSKAPGNSAKKLVREGDEPPVVYVDVPDDGEVEFTDEVEPNNELAQASLLALGTGVRGALDGEKDADFYRVDIVQAGALRASLTGIDKVDLLLELTDESGKVLATSDRGPALMSEGIPNFAVMPGTYQLVVREFIKKRKPKKRRRRGKKKAEAPVGRIGLSPTYELRVSVRSAPERFYEVEDNSADERANEAILGDDMHGYMGWAGDVDMWKLSIEGFAADYSLDFELEGVPGVTFKLQMYDDTGDRVLERRGDKGTGLSIRNLVVADTDVGGPLSDSGEEVVGTSGSETNAASEEKLERFYIARLSARRSNPVEAYRVRMSTRLLELEEEAEPNDTPERATALSVSSATQRGVRRGYLTYGDTDRYSLTAADEPLSVSVSVVPEGDIDIVLDISVGGETRASSNAGGAGDKERVVDLVLEAGLRAVITVGGKGRLARDAGYQLRWSAEPSAGMPLPVGDGDEDEAGGIDDDYENDDVGL